MIEDLIMDLINDEEFVLVRVLKSTKIALPDKDLTLRKEDVLHLPRKIARILVRAGRVEYINIRDRGLYELGENREMDMAKVEGK